MPSPSISYTCSCSTQSSTSCSETAREDPDNSFVQSPDAVHPLSLEWAFYNFLGMRNHLAHRKAVTSAEVENSAAPTFPKPLQSKNVPQQIAHVYVITDASPIWCVVVSTKDRHRIKLYTSKISGIRWVSGW